MPAANQYTFQINKEDLEKIVAELFSKGKSDVAIQEWILDNKKVPISTKTIQQTRGRLMLENAWNAKLKPEDIAEDFAEMRTIYPTAGAARMKAFMQIRKNIRVSRGIISQHMRVVEPEETSARKGKSLQRRRLYIAGVNVTWTMDQHDKWRVYGLLLHVGIDICSGYVLWAKIWWNNRNPNLICGYYLDAVDSVQGVPLLTQSDGGSENYNVAKAQTVIRQTLDPDLEGSLQHKWMRSRLNTPPEVFWSGLRRSWAPGYEDLFIEGVAQNLYNVDNAVQRMVFRYLAIPWLQGELDVFARAVNEFKKRKDKHKVLPQGRTPEDIFLAPERSNVLDFKVHAEKELLSDVRQHYAPPQHPVFQLVPPEFEDAMQLVMEELGHPTVSRSSFWEIYSNVLCVLEAGEMDVNEVAMRQMEIDEQMREQESELVAAARTKDTGFGEPAWFACQGDPNVGVLPQIAREVGREISTGRGADGAESSEDGEVDSTETAEIGQAFIDEEGRIWIPGLEEKLEAEGIVF